MEDEGRGREMGRDEARQLVLKDKTPWDRARAG